MTNLPHVSFQFCGLPIGYIDLHDDEELNVVVSEGKILEDVVVEFKGVLYFSE